MMMILRAARMVEIPIVIACNGTLSALKKLLAASARVCGSRVTIRVSELRGLPGSLKPMWPVRPIPSNWS